MTRVKLGETFLKKQVPGMSEVCLAQNLPVVPSNTVDVFLMTTQPFRNALLLLLSFLP